MQLRVRYILLLAMLCWGFGWSSTPASEPCADSCNVGYIATANDLRSHYLAERSTHVALLPEVHYSLAPSTSSRILQLCRQRSTGSPILGFVPVIKEAALRQPVNCPNGLVVGRLHASRAVDYYVYALRHIII
jgi:hypothetical protein